MDSKKDLSERDICTKFIQPALEKAGWDTLTQIREEVSFTEGRIYVRGNLTSRGKQKRADYILYYKPNIPIALIEVKNNKLSVNAGIQQGLHYAKILDIPSVYSSNGDGFYEHDRTCTAGHIEKELSLDEFPSPEVLWQRYKKYKNIETQEQARISSQDYFFDGTDRKPRYYQQIAINRTVEAIARGQGRILLTMATGTGKTYAAFQIIHRLWKSNTKKRILFLADRNALIDQTKRGDFRHFKDKMTVIRKKQIDKSYEIYLALYQGLTNYDEDNDAYRQFSPDFFDLILIDECHRGSAAIANENRDLMAINNKFVMQITGDNEEGKMELDNFINPEEKHPVIATTSKLMTTGVDTQTCKLIVLDSNIGSMTEFKQIIGRGTRINEEFGKTFFTIMDFRGVTDLFSDSDFDGDPVRIKVIGEDDEIESPEEEIKNNEPVFDEDGEAITFETEPPSIIDGGDIIAEHSAKYYVNGVNVAVLNERIQYMDGNGKLINSSLKDYTRNRVREQYRSLDDFINKWNSADKKHAIIKELTEQGIVLENLKEEIGKEMDIFDLICHTAFDQPPLTRSERVKNVKKRNYFTQYGEQARKVLESLLDKYADEGIENIEDMKILQVKPLDRFGSPVEIIELFGGKMRYLQAIIELEQEIYREVA